MGLKLKRPFMSVQDSSFARPSPKFPSPPMFSVIGCCGERHQDDLPASLFAVFHTSSLFSCTKSEIRAEKLPVVPGHLQEELVGGRVRFEANISEYEANIYSLRSQQNRFYSIVSKRRESTDFTCEFEVIRSEYLRANIRLKFRRYPLQPEL